jgi:hypothetical protein
LFFALIITFLFFQIVVTVVFKIVKIVVPIIIVVTIGIIIIIIINVVKIVVIKITATKGGSEDFAARLSCLRSTICVQRTLRRRARLLVPCYAVLIRPAEEQQGPRRGRGSGGRG